jgi:hypothetical protein
MKSLDREFSVGIGVTEGRGALAYAPERSSRRETHPFVNRHRSGALSRVLNLRMAEAEVRDQCQSRGVGVSALEPLPDGGVRLVCMSTEGANTMRTRLKSKLIAGDVRRVELTTRRGAW